MSSNVNNNCYQLREVGCLNAFGWYEDNLKPKCNPIALDVPSAKSGAHSARGKKPAPVMTRTCECANNFAKYNEWAKDRICDSLLGSCPGLGVIPAFKNGADVCCPTSSIPESNSYRVTMAIRSCFQCIGAGILCCCIDRVCTYYRGDKDPTGGILVPLKKGILKNPKDVQMADSKPSPVSNPFLAPPSTTLNPSTPTNDRKNEPEVSTAPSAIAINSSVPII